MILYVLILAVIQGLAELLPVSSSAHVIVAEKMMGLDPSSPEMTFLLVMLHTGTMFAVIVYFWKTWRKSYFASMAVFKTQIVRLIVATAITGVIGGGLIYGIEHAANKLGYVGKDAEGHLQKAEIETLFSNLQLIAGALAAAGILILIAGLAKRDKAGVSEAGGEVGMREASWMGGVQGLCLPFRGFSRSGATISTGMLLGAARARVEAFSFALAVLITPAAIGREVLRLLKHNSEAVGAPLDLGSLFLPGALGMVLSFLAGLLALRWLSRWLESGRWHYFGVYCLVAAVAVFVLHMRGY